MSLLAIDVGAGTQDILLYKESGNVEGLPKIVLPSQTAIVARHIDAAARDGHDIFLQGFTMGGGASTSAVMHHLRAGLRVYATAAAALSIHDDLDRARAMGVIITDVPPPGAVTIETGDVDLASLDKAFGLFGIDLPHDVAVAVQDHGFSPHRSNRIARFEHLHDAICAGGGLEQFAFTDPPEHFNRMTSVRDYLRGQNKRPLLMDTGPAAIFGALHDPRAKLPALAINFGNGHTIGALIDEEGITAIFEHHTSALRAERLRSVIERFCAGTLTNQDIFGDGGHGAYIESVPERLRCVVVTGPRREELEGAIDQSIADGGVILAAPWGDMMMAGCVGLIDAWKRIMG